MKVAVVQDGPFYRLKWTIGTKSQLSQTHYVKHRAAREAQHTLVLALRNHELLKIVKR